MNIAELVGSDPHKAELDRIEKQSHTLKVRKERIKAELAQKRLRAAQTLR